MDFFKGIFSSLESTVQPVYSGSLIVIMAVAAMALCFGYPTLLSKKQKQRCQYPQKLPILTRTCGNSNLPLFFKQLQMELQNYVAIG